MGRARDVVDKSFQNAAHNLKANGEETVTALNVITNFVDACIKAEKPTDLLTVDCKEFQKAMKTVAGFNANVESFWTMQGLYQNIQDSKEKK